MEPKRKCSGAIAGVAVVAAIAATLGCKTKIPAPPPSVPQVVIANVIQRDVPIYSESVGTTDGFINADVRPRISGYLLKQDYRDGSHVHAGQLLFEIDDRPYKAALDQAMGTLAQAQAQLTQNQLDLARYTKLYRAAVVPKQVFDTATQTTRASAAQASADQAAVENAQLNLQWTKVYSPIDGVAGIAQAQVGDLVSPSALLTTVSQLNPIKVSFPISEQEYLRFAERINARVNGAPVGHVQFELILSDGSAYDHPGAFYAANRQVDPQTGTIQVQATFPNPEDILRPGMYAKVRVRTGVQHDAILVPQSAVFEIQGQYQVATVDANHRVTIHNVEAGRKVGAFWLIEQGLRPGEHVVTEGVQKVKEGMEVKPVQASAAAPDGAAQLTEAAPARQE
jgi:RND family efflux transporter MFP subunit